VVSRDGDERRGMLDPEVVPKVERRRFTAEEKLRILEEADACTEPGEIGALLRREGIYSSYLNKWRVARDSGRLSASGEQKRGRKAASDTQMRRELAKLQRENERLQARLDQAEAIIEVQKKLSQLLGSSPRTSEKEDK
jgi:transposase